MLGRLRSRLTSADKVSLLTIFATVRSVHVHIVGGFFGILIYRTTGDFTASILGIFLYYMGIIIGFLVCIPLIKRLPYFATFKAGFALYIIFFLMAYFGFAQLEYLVMFFAFGNGLASGIFFLNKNVFELEELSGEERLNYNFITAGIGSILGVVLPVLTGFLISQDGYKNVMLIMVVVYGLGMLIPIKSDIRYSDTFSLQDLLDTTRLPGFRLYAAWNILQSYVAAIRDYAYMLTPFLILGKSELNIGVLTSGVALATGIAAFFIKSSTHSERNATYGALSFIPLNMLMALSWSPLAVSIRSLLIPIGSIVYDPKIVSMDMQISADLLGNHLKKDGIEVQIIREVLLSIGRLFAALTFFAAIGFGIGYEEFSKFIILIFSGWALIHIYLAKYLINLLKRLTR